MKRFFFLIIAFIAITTGCDKYESAGYDFSNSIPLYAEIVKPKGVIVVPPGGKFDVTITLRDAFQEDVAIACTFNGATLTSKIDRNKRQVVISVAVPTDILGTTVSKNVKFVLLSATGAKTGTKLTIGRYGADKESLDIQVKN